MKKPFLYLGSNTQKYFEYPINTAQENHLMITFFVLSNYCIVPNIMDLSYGHFAN